MYRKTNTKEHRQGEAKEIMSPKSVNFKLYIQISIFIDKFQTIFCLFIYLFVMLNLSSVENIHICLKFDFYCSVIYNGAWKKPIAYTVKSTAVLMAFMMACFVKTAVTSYTISLPLKFVTKCLDWVRLHEKCEIKKFIKVCFTSCVLEMSLSLLFLFLKNKMVNFDHHKLQWRTVRFTVCHSFVCVKKWCNQHNVLPFSFHLNSHMKSDTFTK